MSIKNELVKTFKNLLSVYFSKVYSNAEIKISDKVVGGVIEMIAADGTLSPAPDGDYVMEDGFSFTVKNGMIESIMGQVAPPVVDTAQSIDETMAAPMVAPVVPDVNAPVADAQPQTPQTPEERITYLEDEISSLEDDISSLEERLSQIEAIVTGVVNQGMESQKAVDTFNTIVNELNTNIKTLAGIPVQFSKVDSSVKVVEERQEKMNNLVTILTSNKNK